MKMQEVVAVASATTGDLTLDEAVFQLIKAELPEDYDSWSRENVELAKKIDKRLVAAAIQSTVRGRKLRTKRHLA